MSNVINPYIFNKLPLVPLIAPANFSASAQAVNIYDIFNSVNDINKAYIYQFSDNVNTLTLVAGAGLTYKYGYTRSGVDYVFDVASATNPFTAGDTKRWVLGFGTSIVLNPFQSLTNGLIWVYMHRVADFRLGSKTTLKYVHISNSNLVTPTSTQAPYAFANCSALSGVLTVPGFWTNISSQFANSAGSGLSGALVIPSNVATINDYAFASCAGFTSLALNEGLDVIGVAAFQNANNIVGVLSLPNTVTSLGTSSFSSCVKLTGSILLSNNVIIVQGNVFFNCTGLNGTFTFGNNVTAGGMAGVISGSNMTFAAHNSTNYEVVGNVLYGKVGGIKTSLLSIPKTKTGVLAIEATTTSIAADAAKLATGLNGALTIPNSILTIGFSAFQQCSNLTSLVLSSSLTTIGDYAFYSCSAFTGYLTISASVTSIGASSFFNCTGFTALNLPFGYNLAQTGGNWTFNFSTNFSAISLNQSILNINSGGNTTRTITIGATNKARLLAAFPSAETNANVRGITII